MPGTSTSGNRTGARGSPTRVRRKIKKESAVTLRLLSWQRLGRPASDEEEDAFIDQLIEEERKRNE